MSNKNCSLCGYQFSVVSQKYFCHDKKNAVCIMCRKKQCSICHSIRNNLIPTARCRKCYTTEMDQSKMFYQYQCDSYFCPKCIAKSTVQKQYTVLPCGDTVSNQEVTTYLRQFCLRCGKQFNQITDYQLLDYNKICYKCWNTYKIYYLNDIIRCNICQKQIRHSKLAAKACQDIIVCKECFQQSNIYTKNIEKQAKHNVSHSDSNKQQEKQNEFFDSSNQIKIMQEKPFEKPSDVEIKKQQKGEHQKFVQLDQNQPQIIINSESIKIQKNNFIGNKKQEIIQQNNNLNSKNINLNKQKYFEKQQQAQNDKHPKIKKVFSTQAYLQNIEINIKKDNPQDQYIECQNCNYQILKTDSLIYQSNQGSKYFCRLCFMVKNASTSGYLGFSSKNIDLGDSRSKPVSTSKYKSPQLPLKTTYDNYLNPNSFNLGFSDQKLSKTSKGDNKYDYEKYQLSSSYINSDKTHTVQQPKKSNEINNENNNNKNVMKLSMMNQYDKKRIEAKDNIKRQQQKQQELKSISYSKKCNKCGKQTFSIYITALLKQQLCKQCYFNRF